MFRSVCIACFRAFLYFLAAGTSISAQSNDGLEFEFDVKITLHTIIVADEDDPTLGRAAKESADLIQKLSDDIAGILPVDYNLVRLTSSDFSSRKLKETVTSLDVGEHDAVMFFFFGHGSINTSADRSLPDLQLDQPLQFGAILDELIKKQPRLLIAIADACNSPIELANTGIPLLIEDRQFRDDEYVSPYLVNAYSRLFIESAGHFIISSAGTGQQAYYDLEKGGVYTNIFIKSMREQLRHYRAGWGPTINMISPSLQYSDILQGSEIDQLPITIIAFKDLKNVYANLQIHFRTERQKEICRDPNVPPQCLESIYGIDGDLLTELGHDIPDKPLLLLDDKSLFGMSEFLRPDQYSFELIAMAQRYYWGDGALLQDYSKTVSLLAHSHDLGNIEAAGIVGDMEIANYEETRQSKHLWTGLDWYIRGYQIGDKRSGENWISNVYQHVTSRQHVERAIDMIRTDFMDLFGDLLPDLCREGYSKACATVE